MKTSIKTIGLLAALALGLTSPLFAQVPDLTKDTQSERVAAVSKLLSKTDPLPSSLLDAQFIEEQAGASAGAVKSRTFNVLNYGAVGDDKTDNTEAFSACLKAVIADVLPGAQPKDWLANPAKHQVVIRRDATDKQQAAMIAAAEAAQPSKEKLREAAEARDRNDPLGLAQPKGAKAPVGDNVWWYKEQLGIRIPCAITADAVAYYSDLVGKYGKQVLKRYTEPSSRLDYHAGVAFHKEFKLGGKTFNNVHVVTLKLTFDQNFAATQTEGMHFEKKRVVVLDGKGKVLHISGDGPTEVPILAI